MFWMFVYRAIFASEGLIPLGRVVGIVAGNSFDDYHFRAGLSYQFLDEPDRFEDVVSFGFEFIVTLMVY